ncbi:hypothetical protein [Dictyobacter arantiisoli]|uniref:SnoaL-like domain-containing protein n=1 Tax=Dictyobacter arantiisoli TaxID=2014874 RepID=A0A5A5TAC4_9CHLR|nr:hypothetical protein [Dictyobacter arantiisoli]GCF07963.1 hypothetical protein KDI_15270 [Dictyobacter arantiisoli]
MSTTNALTENEVRQFVTTWFHKLDIHTPLEDFLSMVADESIEFRFPEVTVTDQAGLIDWYNRVTHSFFDEVHETKELTITPESNRAKVDLLTHWQASTWDAPAARSQRIEFLAQQTWYVVRSNKTGQPVVSSYLVNSFDPVGDSAALPVK